jgi:mRNA interferase MazF
VEGLKRGQLWWAGGRRPVLIVQEDLLTSSRLASVMVVPLTSNLERAKAVGNVLLESAESGLRRDSVALVCQLLTVDKTFLDELIGSLSRRTMQLVDAGLRLALDLR